MQLQDWPQQGWRGAIWRFTEWMASVLTLSVLLWRGMVQKHSSRGDSKCCKCFQREKLEHLLAHLQQLLWTTCPPGTPLEERCLCLSSLGHANQTRLAKHFSNYRGFNLEAKGIALRAPFAAQLQHWASWAATATLLLLGSHPRAEERGSEQKELPRHRHACCRAWQIRAADGREPVWEVFPFLFCKKKK